MGKKVNSSLRSFHSWDNDRNIIDTKKAQEIWVILKKVGV